MMHSSPDDLTYTRTDTESGADEAEHRRPSRAMLTAAEAVRATSDIAVLPGRPTIGVVDAGHATLRLRVLPPATTRSEIDRVHQLLASPPMVETGHAQTPASPKSIIEVDGRLVEVMRWVEGRDLSPRRSPLHAGHAVHRPAPAPADVFPRLVAAVAELHKASEASDALRRVRHVTLRDTFIESRAAFTALRRRIERTRVREPRIGRWLRVAEPLLRSSHDLLAESSFLVELPEVATHRNLWPGHVISDGARLHLIDWTRVARGSALVDLVQVVGHFRGWDSDIVEAALEQYTRVRPLLAEERRLLPAVAAVDLTVETGRLLLVAFADPAVRPESDAAEAARSGSVAALASLEAVAGTLRRLTNPTPWRRFHYDSTASRGSRRSAPREAPRRSGARRPKP